MTNAVYPRTGKSKGVHPDNGTGLALPQVLGVALKTPAKRSASAPMKTQERRPWGEGSVIPAGRRWRAFWRVHDEAGRRRRKSQLFDSRREAQAFLDALPQHPVVANAPATLGDAIAQLAGHTRFANEVRWMQRECSDLLHTRLTSAGLAGALKGVLVRRSGKAPHAGRPTRLVTLACEVRKFDGAWHALRNDRWELIQCRHASPTRAAGIAQKLDESLTQLTNGQQVTQSQLHGGRGWYEVLVKRGLVLSPSASPAAESSTRRVAALRTIHGCRAMLRAALSDEFHRFLPSAAEGESDGDRLNRRLAQTLGGRGMLPPLERVREVLALARQRGSAPTADDESHTAVQVRRALALIAVTGLRSGEARALRWKSIHLAENRIWVTDEDAQQVLGRAGTKTPRSQRDARLEYQTLDGLTAGLLDDLRSWRGELPDEALVFARDDGRPLRAEALLDGMQLLSAAAGVHGRLKVHDLRHLFGRFARTRWRGDQVADKLGHTSVEFSDSLYASPTKDEPA